MTDAHSVVAEIRENVESRHISMGEKASIDGYYLHADEEVVPDILGIIDTRMNNLDIKRLEPSGDSDDTCDMYVAFA